MDRLKVINDLQDAVNDDWMWQHADYYAKAMENAIALLKEQEPKPIAYTDNPYTGLPVARCPKCGKFARQFHAVTDEETHFCPWCGQAVKWNG